MKIAFDFKNIDEDMYAESIAENLIIQAIIACPDFYKAVRIVKKAHKFLGEAILNDPTD